MTTWLPAIVGVIYGVTAISWLISGDLRWFLVWSGYSVAQIGLVLLSQD